MTTTYGTLTATVGLPAEVTLVRPAVQTPASSGVVFARSLRQNVSRQGGQPQTRLWSLVFGPTDQTSLIASFDAAMGAALPLSWTPPPPDDSGGAIPVRFKSGTLSLKRSSAGMYEAQVELEEVS